MLGLTIQERASLYNQAFPDYPPLVCTDRWLYGMWMIGSYYKNATKLYGAYPHSYLERIMSMYPDVQSEQILHLFSGSLGDGVGGLRIDINPDAKPDIVGDAHDLGEVCAGRKFRLILSDPPYSVEDCDMHYGTPMINRNKVMKECVKVLEPEGHVVWLDQVLPMYSKEEFELVGTIGLIRSTNHRFRVVSIFRRV